MARIRTVKPEFWKHEALSELPEATHMLAAALLNYADDFGYFNANPKLIQAECSPLREPSVSIHESLVSLQAIGYIALGTADGKRYGRVINFETHQRVAHPSKSKIQALSIVWEDYGKPHEILVRPPETFRPEQGTGNREQGMEQGKEEEVVAPVGAPLADQHDDLEIPLTLDRSECGEAVRRWNVMAERAKLSAVQRLTGARRKKLTARLRECDGLDGWDVALAKVEASKFLCGRNPRGWRADFKFILQQESFTKLMEGGFDRAPPDGGGGGEVAEVFDEIYAELGAR